jgi:RNA polymerase sigma-54 factor
MSLSLQPSLRQTTSISPQIQQSLQLLQTPALELQTLLQTELQTNPVLEEELPVETPETTDPEQDDEDPLGQNLDWPVSSSRPDRPRIDPRQALLESKVLPESLTDHLVSQLALSAAAPAVRQAATEIIGNLDEDGFLQADLSEITTATGVPPEVVQQALTLVQSFHPPGIAARSLPALPPGMSMPTDAELEPGDTIYVYERFF